MLQLIGDETNLFPTTQKMRGCPSPGFPTEDHAGSGCAGMPRLCRCGTVGSVSSRVRSTRVWSAVSPFPEAALEEQARKKEEDTQHALCTQSTGACGDKIFQVWKNNPGENGVSPYWASVLALPAGRKQAAHRKGLRPCWQSFLAYKLTGSCFSQLWEWG